MERVALTTTHQEGAPERAGTAPLVGPADLEPGEELRRLYSKFRRRLPSILSGLLLVLAAVTVLTLVWPRTYQSSSLIVIEEPTGVDDAKLALLGQLGRATQIETEIELIKSRHVMEHVVEQLGLHTTLQPLDPTPTSFSGWVAEMLGILLPGGTSRLSPRSVFPRFEATPDASPGLYRITVPAPGSVVVEDVATDRMIAGQDSTAPLTDSASAATYRFGGVSLSAPDSAAPGSAYWLRVVPFTDAVQATLARVSVARAEREADLIEVKCEDRSPAGARQLCQTVVDNYVQLRTEMRRAEAGATATFLRGQSELLDQSLAAAEDSLEAYRSRNHVVALGDRASEEVRQSTQLLAQRDQLVAERTALSGFTDQIQNGGDGTRRYRELASFPTFLQNPAVTQLLANLESLENQRGDLLLRRAETSTDVTELDGRISTMEQQMLSMAQSYRRALDDQIGSLDGALHSAGSRLAAIPAQQVESGRLERQVGLLSDMSGLLKTRLREAEVAEAVNLPNVRVVDQASLPERPARPRLRTNLLFGTALGLSFGLLLAIYREGTDSRVCERADVERDFALPVLAMVPHLSGSHSVLPVPTLRRPDEEARLLDSHRGSRRHASKNRLIARQVFRSFAMDLWFTTRDHAKDGTIVAVTSAGMGEGKTFVACNLALARVSQGVRTLLIDADVRGRGATRFFGVDSSSPGLSDILQGNPALHGEGEEGVWQKRVWVGLMNNAQLWVIPPGSASVISARYAEFTALLEQLRPRFDLIVIDTPPMNLAADTAAIAAVADAVLVVARRSITSRKAFRLTLDRLGRTQSSVVGAVLNDVKPPRDSEEAYQYAETEEVPV